MCMGGWLIINFVIVITITIAIVRIDGWLSINIIIIAIVTIKMDG